MEDDSVRVERREGWHKLTLNRPDKLNALNEHMLAAARSAFDAAEADPSCRAVLLTGEGRGFCAGQELNDSIIPGPDKPSRDLGALAHANHHILVRRIRALRLPVVCAVNGVAAGAGANLALACDIVVAGMTASFVQAFVRIGLVPDSGGTFFLPRLVGDARARALALLGESVPAAQAAEWGMIWQAVADDSLMVEAEAITTRLATLPTEALGLMKRLFNESGGNTLDHQLDAEARAQTEAGRTADCAEGIRAFVEKRRPVFKGRS